MPWRAFGFTEGFRMAAPENRVQHAGLVMGESVLMLASVFPDRGAASPKALPARHGLVLCYVDDVDAHHARALGAGAEVLSAEGHHCYFATHARDVEPSELGGECSS